MSILLGLQGVGLGLSLFGGMQDDAAQARAARRSADWLDEQADYFRRVTDRKKEIFSRQSRDFNAYQALATAGNGVSLEGSFLETEAQTENLQNLELEAIEAQGKMQIREARAKAFGLRHKADSVEAGTGFRMMGNILSSKFLAGIMTTGKGTIPESNTGKELWGMASNFFKGEYDKAMRRKDHSILSGGY